ncbi:hypothetical protein LIER_16039 [Lithospermum erythrorhizon]|uniref:Uncharacterized protein n=1 Tax=Lithospermum erythrorhizon TaxID=34254 RepID=A0AAV3Q7K6_LITER
MMVDTKRKKSFLCSGLPCAILLSAAFFVASVLVVIDHKQRFPEWQVIDIIRTINSSSNKICERKCKTDGSEALPRGIVVRTTNLETQTLWEHVDDKKRKPLKNLLAIAVGLKQKQNVNQIINKFPSTKFAIMLFHYDGNVDGWSDLEWSTRAIHISAINQTKWWFAKRFLHPDIIADYAYIFLWDEDLGVEHFHVDRYLSIVKEEGLEISQPAVDADLSEVHHKITAREKNSTAHRY